MTSCPLCRQAAEAYFVSSLDVCVRSDWLPVPANSFVFRCSACAHLFKTRDFIESWSNYDDYHMFANSAQMDKLDFGSGYPKQRSRVLIDFLLERGLLGRDKQVLDFGCNRGAFLVLLAGEGHAGFDVSEEHRGQIEGLGFPYYTPQRPPPRDSCDCLVLCHVAEHLGDIASALAPGLNALRQGGTVLIQVPAPAYQPTDLYVMDHYSHFSPTTLVNAMAAVGLECTHRPQTLIGGEWTAAFRKGCAPSPTDREEPAPIRDQLVAGEKLLWAEKESGRPVFLYGAGYLGSMVASFFGTQTAGFIDDNPMLQSRAIQGKKVYSLQTIPGGARVIVTVPPTAATRVAAHCERQGLAVVTPFLPALDF